MALKYYEALNNINSVEPVNEWQELMQEAINDTWYNTSTVTKVKGQLVIGGKTYGNESVQLNSVIEPKTSKTFGDDLRLIIYKNLENNRLPPNVIPNSRFLVSSSDGINTYQYTTVDGKIFLVRKSDRYLGKYYQFDSYHWLTINTYTTIGSVAMAIIQRCNQKLKWYDNNGDYHEWYCVVGRTLSEKSFNYGKDSVIQVGADLTICVQQNEETKKIQYNQRFIFNGKEFQVKGINDLVSETYMELYLFQVQVQSTDDTTNNIYNADGLVQNDTNGSVLLPRTNEIKLNESVEFSIYNYTNGKANNDTFSIVVNGGISNVNYSLTIIDGNNFIITNILQTEQPIVVTCTNNTDNKDIVSRKIVLGGIW